MTRALAICLGVGFVAAGATEAAIWTAEPGAPTGERFPAGSPVFTLDRAAFDVALAGAPEEWTVPSPVEIDLPMPDGTWERFAVYRARVMHPELAEKYPEIRPYRGLGRNSRWRARFELTPAGFEASIWNPKGQVLIEPVPGENRYAVSFLRDLILGPEELGVPTCEVLGEPGVVEEHEQLVNDLLRGGGLSHGDNLYTYRLAFAVTGEFTAQAGGTVALGLARIVETVNRLNEIMGQEWSVALELVPNNDLLVYTDGGTDPYSNGSLGQMIDQNQDNLDLVIGNANYDIGHVSGTGGESGLAGFRVVCVNSSKARGAGQHNATGGEQYKLVTAHEMGHQFAASHTFNSSHSSCIGQRSGSSAYEPGGGSTIMGYAGRCGDQEIQPDWDPHYHSRTYTQVVANITGGPASGCAVVTPTGNTPPAASAETVGHTVPLDTPWVMDGSGTDADGDSLTYCWEQYDLGPAGHPDTPVDNAPMFRSFRPATATFRYFPKLARILNDNHRIGEILPTYERTLRLRLTVRDGLGGVHWDQGFVGVDGTAGPFRVTSQSTATTWGAGTQQMVTWDVANSDNGIVNCQTVDILMSEGAFSFPHVLASGTPNDGSEMIVVPAVAVPDARIMVRAADNIFYDLNDGDITIDVASDVSLPAAAGAGLTLEPARPNPFAGTTSIAYSVAAPGHASMRIYDTAGRLVRVLFDERVSAGRHVAEWDGLGGNGSVVASGVYFVRLKTERGRTDMQKVHLLR